MNHFAIRDTEQYPGTGNLSQADFAMEVFRCDHNTLIVQNVKLPEVPEDWKEQFTPLMWQQFTRDRFYTWHSEGWTMRPEYWLKENNSCPLAVDG